MQEPLAEGPYFDLLRPVDDETAVRAAAHAAIGRAGEHDSCTSARSASTARSSMPGSTGSAIAVLADAERAAAFAGLEDELRARFERAAERVPDGYRFRSRCAWTCCGAWPGHPRPYPAAPMATTCEHVDEIRDDWAPVADPRCESCAREGRSDWVSPALPELRAHRLLRLESGPPRDRPPPREQPPDGADAPARPGLGVVLRRRAHGQARGRRVGRGRPVLRGGPEGYAKDHLAAGGEPDVDEEFVSGKGFPLGQWPPRCGAGGRLAS